MTLQGLRTGQPFIQVARKGGEHAVIGFQGTGGHQVGKIRRLLEKILVDLGESRGPALFQRLLQEADIREKVLGVEKVRTILLRLPVAARKQVLELFPLALKGQGFHQEDPGFLRQIVEKAGSFFQGPQPLPLPAGKGVGLAEKVLGLLGPA